MSENMRVFPAVAVLVVCAASSNAATIFDYTNFTSTGLTFAGNPTVPSAATALELTTSGTNESGAAYQAVTLGTNDSFSTVFTFQFTGASSGGPANGIAFVLAADPGDLPSNIATNANHGDDLGYTGIDNSLAVAFNTYYVNNCANFTAIDKNGSLTNTDASDVYGISSATCTSANYTQAGSMSNGDIWTATISYDGTGLTVTLQDPQEPSSFTAISYYDVNLASVLGTGDQAYVALTGGTGSDYQQQDILSWELSDTPTVPEPSTVGLFCIALGWFAARLRRRTSLPGNKA